MSTTVAAAVLAAAALHALWNALVKGRAGEGDPLIASLGLTACWAVLGWPLVAAAGPMDGAAWPMLLGSTATHIVYFTLLNAAYRKGDLSLVYPISRGTPPLLVALGAAALGEPLDAVGACGVAVLTAGVLILAPLGRGARADRAQVALAAGCAVCTAAYTLLDGHGVRLSGSAAAYVTRLVALQGTLFALLAAAWVGPDGVRRAWAARGTGLGAGLMSAAGYGVALWAMTRAPIAAVAALRETAVPMAAILGAAWLGERVGPRRALATLLVAIGAVMLRLSGTTG